MLIDDKYLHIFYKVFFYNPTKGHNFLTEHKWPNSVTVTQL